MTTHLEPTWEPTHGRLRSRLTRSIRTRRGRLLSAFLAVLFTLAQAVPASAHAELLSSNPAAGALLAESPGVLTLVFSEEVSSDTVRVSLVDVNGTEQAVHVMVLGQRVDLHPLRSLPAGGHVISWKVISADGHLVSGLIPFDVGPAPSASTTTVTGPAGDSGSPIGEGGAEVPITDAPDLPEVAVSPDEGSVQRLLGSDSPLDRAAEIYTWAALVLTFAAVLTRRRSLVVGSAVSVVVVAALRVWDLSVRFGGDPFSSGEARAALTVAAAGVLAAASVVRVPAVVALPAAVVAFTAQSLLSGHHLDLDNPTRWFATAAHAAHLGAVLCWCAAVVALLLRRDVVQLRQTRRISTASVAVLAVAGPVLTFTLIRPVDPANPWVMVLAAKFALLALVAALAVVHHHRSGLPEPEPTTWRRGLRVEGALLLGVALLSGVLTTHTPPAVTAAQQGRVAVALAGPQTDGDPAKTPAGAPVGDFSSVPVTFNGGTTGTLDHDPVGGVWTLRLDQRADTDTVDLVGANPDAGLEGLDVVLTGDGRTFTGTGPVPLPGTWQVELTFLAGRFDLQSTTVLIQIGEPE